MPGKILDAWSCGVFDLIVSPEILDEYKRVLQHFDRKLLEDFSTQWMTAIISRAIIVASKKSGKRWCRDSFDDMFINCALLGRADHLVTGDKDLLVLKNRVPANITTPRDFLKML